MRAILLFGVLILLVAGAYFFQQYRFGAADAAGVTKKPAAAPDELVMEVGGTAPVNSNINYQAKSEPVKNEAAKIEAPKVEIAPANNTANTTKAPAAPPAEPKKPEPPPEKPAENPNAAKTVKLTKGSTIYKIAMQHYGSGSKAVLADIAAASKIKDPAKVAENATIVLPKTAGGVARKD